MQQEVFIVAIRHPENKTTRFAAGCLV